MRFDVRETWKLVKERLRPSYEARPWAYWGAGAALLFVVLVAFGIGGPTVPNYHASLLPTQLKSKPKLYRPMVVGFYEPSAEVPQGTSSYASLVQNSQHIDVLSPYWYRLGAGGVLVHDTANPTVVSVAHKHKIRVWPLVGNNGWDMIRTRSGRVLSTRNLLRVATQNHYDGIFIDFELIPANQRQDFSAFMVDVANAFHKKKMAVGVAVFPKIGVTKDVQGVYDYPVLGKVADAVAVMTYDHHQDSSGPGAVAPLPWVRQNMQFALRSIPKQKLFMGVGTYGYNWSAKGSAMTVSTKEVQALLSRLGIKPKFAASQGEPHFTYYDAYGLRHVVWYEDSKTFNQKLAVAKKLKIGGVAIWRLGGETSQFWKALAQANKKPIG